MVSFLKKGKIDIFTFLKFSHLERVLCPGLALLSLISHSQQPYLGTIVMLSSPYCSEQCFRELTKIYKTPLTVSYQRLFQTQVLATRGKLISEACEISLCPHSSDGLGSVHIKIKLLEMEAERLDLLWKRWSQLCCENQPEGNISTLSW